MVAPQTLESNTKVETTPDARSFTLEQLASAKGAWEVLGGARAAAQDVGLDDATRGKQIGAIYDAVREYQASEPRHRAQFVAPLRLALGNIGITIDAGATISSQGSAVEQVIDASSTPSNTSGRFGTPRAVPTLGMAIPPDVAAPAVRHEELAHPASTSAGEVTQISNTPDTSTTSMEVPPDTNLEKNPAAAWNDAVARVLSNSTVPPAVNANEVPTVKEVDTAPVIKEAPDVSTQPEITPAASVKVPVISLNEEGQVTESVPEAPTSVAQVAEEPPTATPAVEIPTQQASAIAPEAPSGTQEVVQDTSADVVGTPRWGSAESDAPMPTVPEVPTPTEEMETAGTFEVNRESITSALADSQFEGLSPEAKKIIADTYWAEIQERVANDNVLSGDMATNDTLVSLKINQQQAA